MCKWCPFTSASRRPTAVWSGFPPRSRTRCREVHRFATSSSLSPASCAPSKGCCEARRAMPPFLDLLALDVRPVHAWRRWSWTSTSSTSRPGMLQRQGVALDPAKEPPSSSAHHGPREPSSSPWRTHDRGDFALPWTPSTNPARVGCAPPFRRWNSTREPSLDAGAVGERS